jgi:hypothetical protein
MDPDFLDVPAGMAASRPAREYYDTENPEKLRNTPD